MIIHVRGYKSFFSYYYFFSGGPVQKENLSPEEHTVERYLVPCLPTNHVSETHVILMYGKLIQRQDEASII